MIDILLMYNLLKALPSHMTLILVGDTDQLPSVGAGNVLKDIIASGAVYASLRSLLNACHRHAATLLLMRHITTWTRSKTSRF